MKKIGLIFIISILISNLFGWGGLAHIIITENAMRNLPAEMPVSEEWKAFIVDHCSDPDKRKDETPGEEERHYIDIDFYEEFNRGEMITSKQELMEKYGEEKVVKMGILPWAILETYQSLTLAFQQKNKENILLYASDLAHYVEDGSQPQHVILNYNGKMTDQRGIHGRYETDMIERFEDEIRTNMNDFVVGKEEVNINNIFCHLADANSLAPIIFAADRHALKYTDNYDDEYYRLLWFKTKFITQIQFKCAAEKLTNYIYSAWLEAGKPEIP